jgi:hypothetical protein
MSGSASFQKQRRRLCNRNEADRLIIELTRRGAVSPGSVDRWQRVVDGVYLKRGQSRGMLRDAASSHTKSLVLVAHADVGLNKHLRIHLSSPVQLLHLSSGDRA